MAARGVGTRVPKTRNAGTQSEAAYWGSIRSALRRAFRFWKPIVNCKTEARRAYQGKGKRQKWEYQCNYCEEWFAGKETQVDHIIPVGTLQCGDDLKGFLERLTPEEGFQVLCLECHKIKTDAENEARRKKK